MKHLHLFLGIAFVAAAAVPGSAQQGALQKYAPKKSASADIPVDARPPKGMCRVWIERVPAAQQPAATDCPAAVKNRPANSRVIFGDDFSDSPTTNTSDRSRFPPDIKGFTGVKPPPRLLPKRPPEL